MTSSYSEALSLRLIKSRRLNLIAATSELIRKDVGKAGHSGTC